ncbi:MAG TPA: hypothetical protein VFA27_01355 [Vicinamibacterales bacterium]|nr:hypothetical protein [Vicinamibacterales bacterium]
MTGRSRWFVCLLALVWPASARAQTLPAGPIEFADGRVTIAGDVSAGYGSNDTNAFFNYTDYDHSALRLFRIDLDAAAKANEHLSLLAEVRTENTDYIEPYALYARIRPWTSHAFDIDAGRIPPIFGAFARRTYANDNPLIGYPLAYQYLTSLRPDSLPASADDLLRRRGLGWLDRFSIGNQTLAHGVPLVSAFSYDTGFAVHAGSDRDGFVSGGVAVTAGTVSNPRVTDDNSGRQWAGRVQLRPAFGLVVGTSLSRGPWVTNGASQAAVGEANSSRFTQSAWGTDVEYSRDRYVLRAETILSVWRLPILNAPTLPPSLQAFSTSLEGRYKVAPGVYVAARFDHLAFSDVTGSTTTLPWDAPVTRVEVGPGISLQRNLLLKLSYQYNSRAGGPLLQHEHQGAFQLVYWF